MAGHKPVAHPFDDRPSVCCDCSDEVYLDVLEGRAPESELVLWKDCTWHVDVGLPKPR